MKTTDRSIKSATRVLELLQYFNPERPEARVMDIARTLGYPQSSTSQLMRHLMQLGYLHYDRHKRLYSPTVQVALLGAWVQPYLFRQGHLLPMMDEISESTNQFVALATRVGIEVEYIHVIQSKSAMQMYIPQGTKRPLLRSATGKALLSLESDEQILKLAHRINAEAAPEHRVSGSKLLAEIEEIRTQGHALSTDAITPGGGMVAMPLPIVEGNQPLAIGIGGLSSIVKQKRMEYAATLNSAIDMCFSRTKTFKQKHSL